MDTRAIFGAVTAMGAAGCIQTDIRPQAEYPDVSDHASPPPVLHQTDRYEQIQKPEVDILWVVDNSGSMGNEQVELGENFPTFMDYFLDSNLDYHIGVVSTDMADPDQSGKLVQAAGVRWITPETPNPEEVFAAMSMLGTNGSGNEEGLLATYAALELQDGWNAGFIRDTSALHIVVVSDEGDHSPPSPVTAPEEAEYLNGLRNDPAMVTFNSIVAPDPICPGTSEPGTAYLDMTERVGGVAWSLCEDNWVGALEAIGLQAAGLKREYFLTERPVPGTIRVSVVDTEGYTAVFDEYDPVSQLGDWTYNDPRNSITFLQYIPDPGYVVTIDYDILAANEHVEE